jgi:hypothetical protein
VTGGFVRVVLALLAIATTSCSESTPAAPPTSDGAEALHRVVRAEGTLVYTGYKRAIHGMEGEARATRMKVSRGPDGRTLVEWSPGEGPGRCWEYRHRDEWLKDPDLLLRNYAVAVDPADGPPVAWRDTRRLTIRGLRPGRPSVELLVDKETWLVLSEEIRDAAGRTWLTKVFDTIEYRVPDPPSAQAGEPIAAAQGETSSAALALEATFVPPGFVLTGRDRAGAAVREYWSDGLAAFSIVERPVDAESAGTPEGPAREGELQRRSCTGRAAVSGVFGGIEVRVAGNLPTEDLEAVARGLAPSK